MMLLPCRPGPWLRRALVALVYAGACSKAAQGGTPHARDPFQAPPGVAGKATDARPAPAAMPAMSAAMGATIGTTAAAGGTVATAPDAPTWQLQAVILDGPRSLANINGRIISIGESIDGWQVVAIDARSARLRQGARRMTLTINPKAYQ